MQHGRKECEESGGRRTEWKHTTFPQEDIAFSSTQDEKASQTLVSPKLGFPAREPGTQLCLAWEELREVIPDSGEMGVVTAEGSGCGYSQM